MEEIHSKERPARFSYRKLSQKELFEAMNNQQPKDLDTAFIDSLLQIIHTLENRIEILELNPFHWSKNAKTPYIRPHRELRVVEPDEEILATKLNCEEATEQWRREQKNDRPKK